MEGEVDIMVFSDDGVPPVTAGAARAGAAKC